MGAEGVAGTDWSASEIDLIVADYFDMLALDLASQPYVKSHHNEALQNMTGRSRGSIEFKHQNISAVLMRLGLPWIAGYKPMANFQKALIDGIERYLGAAGETPVEAANPQYASVAETPSLWIEPPPALHRDEDEQSEPESIRRLVRKFDPAARDARNRRLGQKGEQIIFEHERKHLVAAGRDDLAKRVRWISQEDGDGAGYDIHSFEPTGRERLIEVKTTIGHALTPFFLSENERAVSEERRDAFRLMRIYDFARRPSAFELAAPLTDWVRLVPTVHRAEFR